MSVTVRVKDLLTGNDTDLVILSPGELSQATKEALDPTDLFIVGTVTSGATPSVSIVGRTVNFVLQQGPQGVKGDTGATGATGEQGIQGIKGDKGDPGADGTVAFDSLTPAQKLELKGDKGDKGDTGDQGIQGIKGDKGDKGDTGDIGPQGPTGATGSTGAQGAPGYVMPVNLTTPATGTGSFDEAITNNIRTFQATENGTYTNGLVVTGKDSSHDVFMYEIGGVWSQDVKGADGTSLPTVYDTIPTGNVTATTNVIFSGNAAGESVTMGLPNGGTFEIVITTGSYTVNGKTITDETAVLQNAGGTYFLYTKEGRFEVDAVVTEMPAANLLAYYQMSGVVESPTVAGRVTRWKENTDPAKDFYNEYTDTLESIPILNTDGSVGTDGTGRVLTLPGGLEVTVPFTIYMLVKKKGDSGIFLPSGSDYGMLILSSVTYVKFGGAYQQGSAGISDMSDFKVICWKQEQKDEPAKVFLDGEPVGLFAAADLGSTSLTMSSFVAYGAGVTSNFDFKGIAIYNAAHSDNLITKLSPVAKTEMS